ncbi:MAG: membrane dipeptidase [Candidatus Latescibacterota bacterium]|nr:membrane dipeptidase [Candidatus Latescibacterota bacterium]
MLLVDAHLDLAMNALNWDRDLNLSVSEIRKREKEMTQKGRGCNTCSLPELRRAEVGLSVVTVISRTRHTGSTSSGAATQEISCAHARGQLGYYQVLEEQGKVAMIADVDTLDTHVQSWLTGEENERLGFILSMEGADPVVCPDQIHTWWADGLRVLSLSHYGLSAYAHGHDMEGGLRGEAKALLREMASAGMILDVTHLSDQSFWEALDNFPGELLASHSNCRALVNDPRQLSDAQLKALIERGAVVGTALDAWMLKPGWVRGVTQPEGLTLKGVTDQIDHVCQLAGNCLHAGIGSDLDGGYGTEQTPSDLDTIADLQRVAGLLRDRGYGEDNIATVMHGNWIRHFRQAWI